MKMRGLVACIVLLGAIAAVSYGGQAAPLGAVVGAGKAIQLVEKRHAGHVLSVKLKRIPGTCNLIEKGMQGGGGCKAPAKYKCEKSKGDKICCCYEKE